jgi:hypothetical protein
MPVQSFRVLVLTWMQYKNDQMIKSLSWHARFTKKVAFFAAQDPDHPSAEARSHCARLVHQTWAIFRRGITAGFSAAGDSDAARFRLLAETDRDRGSRRSRTFPSTPSPSGTLIIQSG